MHMLLARSAIVRGMQLVAGMLAVTKQDTQQHAVSDALAEFKLVSWTSSAHSRREDELARFRQTHAEP
ncbi:hypothetical protein [Dyella acidisoli]|uniref:Uncharacterized protein n=1 Tax=Dyella acidisoli TaxID=1867834 RepID=A0ABQ5XRB0_9GAMM|nr:hypothetical protein [Dyella acidisoli]GLQ94282.1 hypothetical protein GCM10007901_32330 [Dyella acidisoli]